MKMPKKILFLTLEYPPQVGGVGRYYENLVKHWPLSVTVLLDKLKWPLWPHWLFAFFRALRSVRKENIEMIWVGHILPLGYAAWWIKKRRRIPYIVFTHGMDILVPQQSKWKSRWMKKILDDASLVVANSEFTREELIKFGVKNEKTTVVYPCPTEFNQNVETQGLASLQQDKSRSKTILTVARLVRRKGFDTVIKLLPRLLKRVSNAKYIIVGNGPDIAYLLSLIASLKLEGKVEIRQTVADADLANLYTQASVFALPCRQIGRDVEGFGIVSLEAASFGKPVIVGNSGGASETVHHGYGGFVVDLDSEEELYQALVKLLTDEDFNSRMGEYGKEWVKKNFVIDREAQKLQQAIINI